MMYRDILGHDAIQRSFNIALERGRLGNAYLFVGPHGVGKFTLAKHLTASLLCSRIPHPQLPPCGSCPDCQQVAGETHPDLQIIAKPADKSFIPLELLAGDRQHRMSEGLCHWISLTPFSRKKKIAIIDDVDYLNVEGANSLLKTLEEPPPTSLLILIGTSSQRQLPTILSRCQLIRFAPLGQDHLAQLILEQRLTTTADEAQQLAAQAAGSLESARRLADGELVALREKLLPLLAQPEFDSLSVAAQVLEFVDRSGKEAPLRRARLASILEFVIHFYRQLLRGVHMGPATSDPWLDEIVASAIARANWPTALLRASLERTISAQDQLEANANPATLVDAWLDDLALARR